MQQCVASWYFKLKLLCLLKKRMGIGMYVILLSLHPGTRDHAPFHCSMVDDLYQYMPPNKAPIATTDSKPQTFYFNVIDRNIYCDMCYKDYSFVSDDMEELTEEFMTFLAS